MPTTEDDRERLNEAKNERAVMHGKPLTKNESSVPLIKKGATRPPKDQNPWASLLMRSATEERGSKKGGIGNAVMGGVFKSIYLS